MAQEGRQQERFRVQERTRPLGYGLKEYDHSIQRRLPSFDHTPLVMLSLPGPCRCGAPHCGRAPAPRLGVAGAHGALEGLAAEARRLDEVSRLAPVVVPRGAAVRPELHLGEAGARSLPWRHRQKPWAPRALGGLGLPAMEAMRLNRAAYLGTLCEAKTVLVFRPRQQAQGS